MSIPKSWIVSTPSRVTYPSGRTTGNGSFVSMVTGLPCLNKVKYTGYPSEFMVPCIPCTERGSH